MKTLAKLLIIILLTSCGAAKQYYFIVKWCDEQTITGTDIYNHEVKIRNIDKESIAVGDCLTLIGFYNQH